MESDRTRAERREPRLRTLKGGTIVLNSGQSVVSCLLRDISKLGARLQVEGAMSLPERFILITGEANCRKEQFARVVWRGFAELGVAFD